MYHNICFEQKYKKEKKNQQKIVIFTAVKNRWILQGRVFIMNYSATILALSRENVFIVYLISASMNDI